jgi:hypothetical protein
MLAIFQRFPGRQWGFERARDERDTGLEAGGRPCLFQLAR